MRITQAKPYILTAHVILLTTVMFVQVVAHPFYKYYVVAETGKNGLVSIDPNLSINSKGTVAFVGKVRYNNTNDLVENMFVANGDGSSLRSITSTVSLNPIQQFSPGIQINDNDQIVARRFVTEVFPPPLFNIVWSYLERWDATQVNTFDRVKVATLGQQLHGIYGYPSINNIGAMVYGAFNGNTQLLGLISPSGQPIVNAGANDYRPMYADNGTIAIRFAPPTNRLFVFDEKDNLVKPKTFIAGTENGFSYIGQSPGTSDDGTVVAFYGEKADGAGIFAALIDPANPSAAPTIVKVAGVSNPGGKGLYGELGVDESGNAIFLTNFTRDERVSVIHQSLGVSGPEGDILIVGYTATPSAADQITTKDKGVWTTRIDVVGGSPAVNRPQPVLQVGENFYGSKITDLRLYDALSNTSIDYFGNARQSQRGDHQLAFWMNTDSGEKIVRGVYFDTDEDGLPDHWEGATPETVNELSQRNATITNAVEQNRGGIDVNNDGIIDYVLSDVGAHPTHKNIFIEVDWMEADDHDHRPDSNALNDVVLSFLRAPVPNPDGTTGISLYIDASQSILEMGSFVEWDGKLDNKNSFAALKKANLGRRLQISESTKAKSLAFRYCIFGHNFKYKGKEDTSSGIADPGGEDFLVTLGSKSDNQNWVTSVVDDAARHFNKTLDYTTAFAIEWRDLEAGTFMHELGHTLGLGHGGGSDVNNKPNYLSVMNYSFQYNKTGLDANPLLAGSRGKIRTDRPLDYSSGKFLLLNEDSLIEKDGLQGKQNDNKACSDPKFSGVRTRFFYNGNAYVASAYCSIDWEVDKNILTSPIKADINTDINSPKCRKDPNSNDCKIVFDTLADHDDWKNLKYNFRSSSLFFGLFGATVAEAEPLDEEDAQSVAYGMLPKESFEEVPLLTGISPQIVRVGEAFTLTISGSNLPLPGILFNGILLPSISSKRVADNLIIVEVPAGYLNNPGTIQISLKKPDILGGQVSNSIPLVISNSLTAITITKIDPKNIGSGEQKTVTIEATLAPSDTLLTNSVTLLRYNDKDELVSNQGQMFDDGTHGDRVAGDKIFTTQIVIQETAPQTIYFKASAAFKGQLKRLVSPPETLTVTPATTLLQQRATPARRGAPSRTISPRP